MKKLCILMVAVSFSGPAFAQAVPKKAFYIGLGGGANVTNFSDQSITAIGVSNASNTTTGAHVASGSAGGPPINLGLDSDTSFSPVVQAGYFQQIMDTRWLWGAKFSYSYVHSKSTSNAFLIPQFGSFGATAFTGNAVARSFQAGVDHQLAFIPYVGYLFDRSYIYLGVGPTMSRVKTRIDDLIGFADINGSRTDISGTAQTFTSGGWIVGGAVTIGTTYFLDQSWFLDFNYTYGATAKKTASYYSTFLNVNPNNNTTYNGSLIGNSVGSSSTQSFAVTINKAL
jgi:opacity protein-like surface antigen